MYEYIGFIVFRLRKHKQDPNIKTPTLLGGTILLLGGGHGPRAPSPSAGYGFGEIQGRRPVARALDWGRNWN